jgi:hypothetical protein
VVSDFHLIAIQLGDEEEMLERALHALAELEAGETAFLPEYLAWTARGSGRAFARLIAYAQERDINIVTTLNLGRDLHEDLPGRDPDARYNALVIFTRHGVVHVPQAKITTQSFEMDDAPDGPGIVVTPYERLNRVRLDWQERLIETRFVVCSDLMVFLELSPQQLRCDLLVLLGNFAFGAERAAHRLLERALAAGVASTALFVNAFQVPRQEGHSPLAFRVEDVLDATARVKAPPQWPAPRGLRAAFHVYEDEEATDFVSMCNLPGRRGRIAVPRSRWLTEVTAGEYPIVVSL